MQDKERAVGGPTVEDTRPTFHLPALFCNKRILLTNALRNFIIVGVRVLAIITSFKHHCTRTIWPLIICMILPEAEWALKGRCWSVNCRSSSLR